MGRGTGSWCPVVPLHSVEEGPVQEHRAGLWQTRPRTFSCSAQSSTFALDSTAEHAAQALNVAIVFIPVFYFYISLLKYNLEIKSVLSISAKKVTSFSAVLYSIF